MKKRVLAIIVVLLFGYTVAVVCHLFFVRGVTRQEEVYKKYCTGYETTCLCESKSYGMYETGFPFVSKRDVRFPCGAYATTEQRSINDYSRQNDVAFAVNIFFWSGCIAIGKKVFDALRKKRT